MLEMNQNDNRRSITFEVIQYITLFYFAIAIFLTVFQLLFEFRSIKNEIDTNVSNQHLAMNNSLANSIWEINQNQTDKILEGILSSSDIVGLKLIQEGNIVTHNKGMTTGNISDANKVLLKNYLNPKNLFKYDLKIMRKISNDKLEHIADLELYSSTKIILDKLSRIIFYVVSTAIFQTLFLWLVIILFFNSKVKKPLHNLVHNIASVDPHDPKEIVIDEALDTKEFIQIGLTFNRLISELRKFKDVLDAIIENKTELLKEKSIEVRTLLSKLESAQTQIVNQEKLNSLGLVSAGIAHELKNPLNITKNSIVILKDILEIKDSKPSDIELLSKAKLAKIPNILDLLESSNSRMENIIKNMLLQSRTEYSNPAKVNLNSFFNMNLKIVQKSLNTKASVISKTTTDIDPDLEIALFPNEFGRLLVNMYENSFYALGEKLKLMTSRGYEYTPELNTSVRLFNTDKILITIHDNGIGIAPDIKNRILEPFFTTKPPGLGTGLGLHLAYEIIKKHKGEIKINSEQDVYTEFQISIPINLEQYFTE